MATSRRTISAVIRQAETHVEFLKAVHAQKLDTASATRRQEREAHDDMRKAQSKLAMLRDSVAYFEGEV